MPIKEHLVENIVVWQQLDLFFAECCVFGRLTKESRDNKLAVCCYGYVFLLEEVERRIEEQFSFRDWNRSVENNNEPLRAIVKDYI